MSNVVPNRAKCGIGYREVRFALRPVGPPEQLARKRKRRRAVMICLSRIEER